MGESVQATSTLVQALVLGIVAPPMFAEVDETVLRRIKEPDARPNGPIGRRDDSP